MALDAKKLGVRSLSAAVFVVLLIGSVLLGYLSFTVFFFAVAMMGLHEFYRISEKLGQKPLRIVGFIFGALIYISFVNFDLIKGSTASGTDIFMLAGILEAAARINFSMLLICIFPFAVLSFLVFKKDTNILNSSFYTIVGVVYAVLPFALLNHVSLQLSKNSPGFSYSPMLVLGIIFLIWSNDTFAYLGGSIFGKNKMIERVSPGKTWEGTAIGVVVTFGLSFLFQKYIFSFEKNIWPLLGILVPLLATIGDLVESKLKREAGIKDSGNIMPGHGGILDRFDSLIFVAPFVSFLLYAVHIFTV